MKPYLIFLLSYGYQNPRTLHLKVIITFGYEPLIHVKHAPFNLCTSSKVKLWETTIRVFMRIAGITFNFFICDVKEICREGTPEAQLEMNQAARTSPSGVS